MATNNAINTDKPIEIAAGGTGVASNTAYAVLCGGTTTTNPIQSIASVGTSGQVLTSNGAGALPTFQDATGSGSVVLLETLTASTSASLDFTTGITSTYRNFLLLTENLLPATDGAALYIKISDDGGLTWKGGTAYSSGVNDVAYNSTTVTNANIAAGAQWQVTPAIDSSGGIGPFIKLWLFNLTSGGTPMITGQETLQRNSGSILSYASICGDYTTAITVDGIQLIMSSGNIASGTASLYGITK